MTSEITEHLNGKCRGEVKRHHCKTPYKLFSSIIQWQSPLCVKSSRCFESVVQQPTWAARWTRWPATSGTLCCNCATQLSVLILLRSDMMKQDRCLYLSVCVCVVTETLLNLSCGSLGRTVTPSISVAAVVGVGGLVFTHSPPHTALIADRRQAAMVTWHCWRTGQSIDRTNEKLWGRAVTQLLQTPLRPCLMVGLRPASC